MSGEGQGGQGGGMREGIGASVWGIHKWKGEGGACGKGGGVVFGAHIQQACLEQLDEPLSHLQCCCKLLCLPEPQFEQGQQLL